MSESVYEFEYAQCVTSVQDGMVLKGVLVPMGDIDKYFLNRKYDDIDECTHFLVLHMADANEEPTESTICVYPVASDVSSGFDVPLHEWDYDEDSWNKTLADMIQDIYGPVFE